MYASQSQFGHGTEHLPANSVASCVIAFSISHWTGIHKVCANAKASPMVLWINRGATQSPTRSIRTPLN